MGYISDYTFTWDTAYGRVGPTDAIPAKHLRPGMVLADGKTVTATHRRRTVDTDAVFALAGTWRNFAPGEIVRVKRTK